MPRGQPIPCGEGRICRCLDQSTVRDTLRFAASQLRKRSAECEPSRRGRLGRASSVKSFYVKRLIKGSMDKSRLRRLLLGIRELWGEN
eukprot:1177384-Prorocentrum_minimum.AAC.2